MMPEQGGESCPPADCEGKMNSKEVWCGCVWWVRGDWRDFDFRNATFCGFCGKKLNK